MLRHVRYENTWHRMDLNATLLHLGFLLRRTSTMDGLNNYTDFFRSLNITHKDLEYLYNTDNLTDQKTGNDQAGCYCNNIMRDLAVAYKNYHGYVALVVCLFGTLANVLNIVVLTRKDMVATPINRILTGLATADMLVMLDYIPFAIYRYIVLPKSQIFPFEGAVFILFHMHFTQLLHTISIAITLTLAVWRYIAISFPLYNHAWCTEARCRLALLSSFLVPFVVCAPSYFVFGIKKQTVNENGTREIAYTVDTDYPQDEDFFYQLNFWVLGVVVKFLPCVILTIISCWLINALCRAKVRKQAFKSNNPYRATPSVNGQVPNPPSKSEKRANRTTKMLVAVLLLFLVTEIPQGVLGLLSGILGECFFRYCYHNFGEVMDILALLNGAINFILYCSMSRQFRTTFGELFKPRIMKKRQPATQQTDVQSTYV